MKSLVKKKLPKLNDKQKKIINIVVTSVQIVLVLCSVIFSIIILVNPTSDSIADRRTVLMPVRSDSMAGDQKDSFDAGDAIIVRTPGKDNKNFDPAKLETGDIITFKNPNIVLEPNIKYITHRIIAVNTYGDFVRYTTKGDNPKVGSRQEAVNDTEVLGLYKGKLVGFGKVILFLQTPKYFLLCIILPLAILFIYNLVAFVMMITQHRAEKVKSAKVATIDSEERREQIIAEYLAQQQELADGKKDDDTSEETK